MKRFFSEFWMPALMLMFMGLTFLLVEISYTTRTVQFDGHPTEIAVSRWTRQVRIYRDNFSGVVVFQKSDGTLVSWGWLPPSRYSGMSALYYGVPFRPEYRQLFNAMYPIKT